MLISVLCGLLLVRPSSHRYLSIEFGVFLVDLALYLAIAFVLMTSNRNWPYLMMALQSVPIAAHVCRDAGVLELPYAGTLSAGNSQARTKAKSRNLLNKLLSGAVSKPEEISAKLIQNFGSLGKIITITKDEIEYFCPEDADSVAETLKIVRHAVECSLRERLLAEPITHCGPRLVDYLVGTMGDLSRECLVCLYLDRRNCLVEAKIVAEGTMSSVPFNVREILSPALAYSASALILSHNHPNGTAQPSEADIAQTRQLQSAASILDIKLHDHIIVAGSRYCSMQEMGLLQ